MSDEEKIELVPLCITGKDHFINSDGNWLPCCFLPSMGPRYDKLPFSDKRFNMKGRSDQQCYSSPVFQKWIYKQINDPENAYATCKRMCSKRSMEVKRKEQDVNKFNPNKDTVFIKDLDL